ncbi:MAG TPA: TIGR02587 family membrane protein, partial [Pyrinomonadaceae bacterium]|nr:TIGR02587 family membrane protein [Pyrinomonadaceae bacterium]
TPAAMRPINKSMEEYGRGIIGGLIFSLPLLYTMEVWWTGFSAHPFHLMLYVAATFALLLGYNYYAGIRHDANWLEVMIDSVEEMGLGLLISATALFLLGRISPDMTASEIVGKVVVEAMTVAIGVSVGTAQLGGTNGDSDTGEGPSGSRGGAHFGGQLVIALCGAVLFAANVAPTEEIVMIASEISSWKLLLIALASLVLGAVILFKIDFTCAQRLSPATGPLAVVIGSVITYAVALAASAMILWFFGRFDGQSLVTCAAQTVVLGVAATLGASAGRLLLQSR